jgi:hypothetical protein
MGRKRKYNNSSVISIRVSDEELDDINRIMADSRIERMSDLMREAMRLFRSSLPADLKRIARRSRNPVFGRLT